MLLILAVAGRARNVVPLPTSRHEPGSESHTQRYRGHDSAARALGVLPTAYVLPNGTRVFDLDLPVVERCGWRGSGNGDGAAGREIGDHADGDAA